MISSPSGSSGLASAWKETVGAGSSTSFQNKHRRTCWAANPSSLSCRREALPLHVGQLRLAFRPIGRADPTLQEAHRSEAVQVRGVQPLLLALGPPGPAHEAPPELRRSPTARVRSPHHTPEQNFDLTHQLATLAPSRRAEPRETLTSAARRHSLLFPRCEGNRNGVRLLPASVNSC